MWQEREGGAHPSPSEVGRGEGSSKSATDQECANEVKVGEPLPIPLQGKEGENGAAWTARRRSAGAGMYLMRKGTLLNSKLDGSKKGF